VEPVVRLKLPAGHRVVVARNELEAAVAVVDEQAQVLHHPVGAVEDDDLVLAVVVEIADEEAIARLELPGPGTRSTALNTRSSCEPFERNSIDRVAVVDEEIVAAVAIEVARIAVDEAVPAHDA